MTPRDAGRNAARLFLSEGGTTETVGDWDAAAFAIDCMRFEWPDQDAAWDQYRDKFVATVTGRAVDLVLVRDESGREYLGADSRVLSEHASESEAYAAGQRYLREHRGAWVQVAYESGDGLDVEVT